ncbi:MAG TPA: S41 family peptidase [Candidatus Angelobacter sp.]|nr:S41 family peptidase [Candidatus Angelobacter sp.]
MKRIGFYLWLLGWLAFGPVQPGICAETNEAPHFQELFRLLRTNLPDVSEEDLNRAAVQGLLNQFYPRVILSTNSPTTDAGAGDSPVSTSTVYGESYGYVRVARVATGLADQIKSSFEKLEATNKLKGLVLDLRYAGGRDYLAAANTADRFVSKEQPLLDWDEGSARATAKAEAISVPLAVLVNQQTIGAAEALAAVLRETDAAVLIGSRTAGQAQVFKEFDLSNGQRLRIATGQVKTGKGKMVPATGVVPDIEVRISAEDERAYFADPFKILPRPAARLRATDNVARTGSTNQIPRRRLNEAELVRLQREGSSPDEQDTIVSAGGVDQDSSISVVRDPALARALDLLKGIAIVERTHTR